MPPLYHKTLFRARAVHALHLENEFRHCPHSITRWKGEVGITGTACLLVILGESMRLFGEKAVL